MIRAFKTKYGNRKTTCRQSHPHDSKLEASVCDQLHLRMRIGEIRSIELQDSVYLTDAKIRYVADFKCLAFNGEIFWVEAKGYPTAVWALKRRLWRVYGPGKLEIHTSKKVEVLKVF